MKEEQSKSKGKWNESKQMQGVVKLSNMNGKNGQRARTSVGGIGTEPYPQHSTCAVCILVDTGYRPSRFFRSSDERAGPVGYDFSP
jgi:hypothetical protein